MVCVSWCSSHRFWVLKSVLESLVSHGFLCISKYVKDKYTQVWKKEKGTGEGWYEEKGMGIFN